MTTIMSALLISVSERARSEATTARAAGWRAADLRWERLQEEAMDAWRADDAATAIQLWRRARWLAFWRIRRSDPRYATSLANAAMACRLVGREAAARRGYAAALALWTRVPGWIAGVEPGRRARSSLFHLRLELRHRDTYVANQRRRMTAFAAEAQAALKALRDDQTSGSQLFERWRAEKLPVFDDTRKFLSAALLIAEQPVQPRKQTG